MDDPGRKARNGGAWGKSDVAGDHRRTGVRDGRARKYGERRGATEIDGRGRRHGDLTRESEQCYESEEAGDEGAETESNAGAMNRTTRATKLEEVLRKRGTGYYGASTHTTHSSQDRIKFKVNESENRFPINNYTGNQYFIQMTMFRH